MSVRDQPVIRYPAPFGYQKGKYPPAIFGRQSLCPDVGALYDIGNAEVPDPTGHGQSS